MKVSVLMNCYNGEEFLKEALDSVFAQTYDNWEIVFYDNSSTDKSAEIAQGYGEKVKYVKGEETVPLYHARNIAIPHCDGDIVGFLDVDDLWLPTKLEKQVPLFTNPDVGLVFSDTIFFNGERDLKRFYDERGYYTGHCFRELLGKYFLSLETVLVRNEALKKLDYIFDERFMMIGDADLFRRVGYQWKLDMVNEPLAKWRVHENSLSWKEPQRFTDETKLMIERYRELFPDLEENYPDELHLLKRDVAIGEAKIALGEGESEKAREILMPFKGSKKVDILYYMSYCPKVVFNSLYKLYITRQGV